MLKALLAFITIILTVMVNENYTEQSDCKTIQKTLIMSIELVLSS